MSKENILIIEDDRDFLGLLKLALSQEGYSIFTASKGEEGLKILKDKGTSTIDLILLDIKLRGELDGIETLKKARKMDKNITVIVLTAYGSIQRVEEAMKSGAYDFINKPCPVNKIKLDVKHAFRLKQMQNEISEMRSKLEEQGKLI